MTPRSFLLTRELGDYVRASSEAADDVVADLLRETAEMAERGEASPTYQIAPEQGVFMQLLTRAIGARRAIEIDDGSLLCLDRSAEWTAVGRRYWERAGLADRIELRLGEALPLLRDIPAVETFDLAFVDADKTGYAAYVEELHGRMSANGVELNAALAADPRWETVLLPLADGLTMLRKR
jgi:caffeoyl-CoA O-methyltransferase